MKTVSICVFAMALWWPLQLRAQVPEFSVSDGPEAVNQVATWAKFAIQDDEHDSVDQVAEAWATTGEAFDDGRARYAALAAGVHDFCQDSGQRPGALESVRAWRIARPRSALAPIVEACIWSSSAWIARGPGYASSVSREGWKLFKERLGKSEKLLLDARAVSSSLPSWYVDVMEVKLGLGRPTEDIDAVFRQGIAKFPEYAPLYFQRIRTASPMWGGDPEELVPLLTRIADAGAEPQRDLLYTRMAWFMQQMLLGNLFDRGVDWPRMKRGFEALMAQHPKSDWNRSAYAAFACFAGDEDSYVALRRRLGDRLQREAFDSTVQIEYCDNRWEVDSAAEPVSEADIRAELHPIVRELYRACQLRDGQIPDPGVTYGMFEKVLKLRRQLAGLQREYRPGLIADGPLMQDLEAADATDAASICSAMRSSVAP